jgi:hypothetical protein
MAKGGWMRLMVSVEKSKMYGDRVWRLRVGGWERADRGVGAGDRVEDDAVDVEERADGVATGGDHCRTGAVAVANGGNVNAVEPVRG